MELFKYLFTCTQSFQEHKAGVNYYIYPTDVTINNKQYTFVTDEGVLLSEEYKKTNFKPYTSVLDTDDR